LRICCFGYFSFLPLCLHGRFALVDPCFFLLFTQVDCFYCFLLPLVPCGQPMLVLRAQFDCCFCFVLSFTCLQPCRTGLLLPPPWLLAQLFSSSFPHRFIAVVVFPCRLHTTADWQCCWCCWGSCSWFWWWRCYHCWCCWQRCWCCCFLAAASAALPMFFVAFAVLPLSAAVFGVLPFLLAAVSAFLCCFGWRRIAPIVVCCLGFGVAAVFGGGIVSVMLPLVFLAAASVAPLLWLLAAALALLPLLFVVSWRRCWHCCLCSWQHHIGGSILGGVLGGIVLLPLIGSNVLLYSCSDPGQEAIINLNKPFLYREKCIDAIPFTSCTDFVSIECP